MDTNPNYSPIQSTPPVWMADYSGRESILPVPVKLNPADFVATDAVKVTVGANAAADAMTVTVTALSGAIPNGEVIDLGGKKFARLTAAAAKNATSLTVAPLATALVTNDTGTYKGTGKKTVPSGTLVGRTYAERDAGTGYGPADVANDNQIYLTAREVVDLSVNNDCELYRLNRAVKENYLPGWAGLATNVKTKIRALYQCIGGVN